MGLGGFFCIVVINTRGRNRIWEGDRSSLRGSSCQKGGNCGMQLMAGLETLTIGGCGSTHKWVGL